jgi:hypothetical protein
MMPEGLLKQYSEQQLRDLFGYLRMTQPLIDGIRRGKAQTKAVKSSVIQ